MLIGCIVRGVRPRVRVRPLALVVVAALLVLPSTASAATRLVAPGGADVGDCTGSPCATIQYGVNQAAPNDTVSVAAGIYDFEPSNRVLINKGLTLEGAGIGQTILDGNNAHSLPAIATLRVDSTSTDPITIRGLTIRNPGSTAAAHGSDNHFGILMQGIAATPAAWTVDQVRVEGTGSATGRDYNFDSQNTNSDLVVTDSEFVGANFNPVLIERHQGSLDFDGNTITKGPGGGTPFFDMNHIANAGNPTGITGTHRFRNNVVDLAGASSSAVAFVAGFLGDNRGPFGPIEVSGNQILNLAATATGVSISNNGNGAGTSTAVSSAEVSGNSVGPGGTGVRFTGLVNGIDVSGNQLVGLGTGIQFNAVLAGHAPAASEVHLNRIVNSATAQLQQNAGGAVDAENNWWGCNEGPNNPGCGTVTGATVDFDPWLVLGLSAAPTSVEVGGNNSTIGADLNHNSAGANVGSAHLDGFPVAWATDLGTIAPPSSPVAAGAASSTLTSGPTAGVANPAATVDNETLSTPVTFTDTGIPETQIDSGPTGGVTIAETSASFSFSSPNDPAASFECRLDSSDPGDFAPCTSPHALAGLSQGPHVFEVRAVDVNSNADPTPARGVFVVDTTPDQGGTAGAVAQVSGACANPINGDGRPNRLQGTAAGDRIKGFGADDTLKGARGYDCLRGGRGDDTLVAGLAGDILQGGSGADLLKSRDGNRDKVHCGPGADTALVDQKDVVRGCEKLRVSFRAGVG